MQPYGLQTHTFAHGFHFTEIIQEENLFQRVRAIIIQLKQTDVKHYLRVRAGILWLSDHHIDVRCNGD